MLKKSLPDNPTALLAWDWSDFEPLYQELQQRKLTFENVDLWLADWSRVNEAAGELANRLYYAVTANTADREIEQRYQDFNENFFPRWLDAENQLKQMLLQSGLEPQGFETVLRSLRAQADLFREENLPLLAEEQILATEYDRISGAQTIDWYGKEMTVAQMDVILAENTREMRERAWMATAKRRLADRQAFNELWVKLLELRLQIAKNAGKADYRDYRWQDLQRFDYTPADTRSFQDAIEEVVVPAAERIYERRRARMGLDTLRPWDLAIDPLGRQPLHPFDDIHELKQRTSAVFHHVHPDLGEYFDRMVRENLLDLENRKNKGPGAYCIDYNMSRQPFIFANAVGLHEDVMTLLHESGHAFHSYELLALPYNQQRMITSEIAEVASMGMELLAGRYLGQQPDGFYNETDAARARVEHLEGGILFWPYMAVVDGFQDWVYTHPDEAADPGKCDQTWGRLWQRFMRGVDWSGLDDEMVTGWQRKGHIFTVPFYYVEYGIAQLGAVQIWGRSLKDPTGAVTAYRRALALGGTQPLPRLFEAAGARLAMDADILRQAVESMESMILTLDPPDPVTSAS